MATLNISTSNDIQVRWDGFDQVWEIYAGAFQQVGYLLNSTGGDNFGYKIGGGMYFPSVSIPPGSTISTAYLSMVCYQNDTVSTVNTKIIGNKELNPSQFTTLADYQSRRGTSVGGADNTLRTTNEVQWDSIPSWTNLTVYNSPDITTVLQEIINQSGWQSGNSIALFWDDHDDRGSHIDWARRVRWKNDIDGSKRTVLIITYAANYENTVTESIRFSDFADSQYTTFNESIAFSDSCSLEVQSAKMTYIVAIALASNPFDVSPTWTDVTADLMNYHIRRGRQWELNRLEAGTALVRLRNLHGNYWPNNTTGSYYPNIVPWKRINIRGLYNGTYYDLYTGYIESWQPTFILKPIKAPVMDLACSDGIKNLSQYNLNSTTGFSQEYSGTRINNVLNFLGWPSTMRTIDTGQSQLQSTGPLANVNAMTHIFTVEDTELGIFYESPSGSMVFQDRHARLKSPYTTSQLTFGDTLSTDKGYTNLDLAFEDLRIKNDIRVTPLGVTTEQVATNTTSQDSYGPRSLERPSLLMVTAAEAMAQAQYLLARYKDPVMRCRQIEIRPNYDPDNLYPAVLGYDLSTRITIKLSQASVNTDYHIEGIYHDYDVLDAAGLKTTWMLSDASFETYWILEDAVFGVLGSTTKLAF